MRTISPPPEFEFPTEDNDDPIERLQLGSRITNALHRAKIFWVSELIEEHDSGRILDEMGVGDVMNQALASALDAPFPHSVSM